MTPALGLLEQAVAQRQSRTLFVRYDPRFEALRGNPGFTRLVDGIDFKR